MRILVSLRLCWIDNDSNDPTSQYYQFFTSTQLTEHPQFLIRNGPHLEHAPELSDRYHGAHLPHPALEISGIHSLGKGLVWRRLRKSRSKNVETAPFGQIGHITFLCRKLDEDRRQMTTTHLAQSHIFSESQG